MTDINHRRTNRKPVNQRYPERAYHNGYATPDNKRYPEVLAQRAQELQEQLGETVVMLGGTSAGAIRVGRTDFLDKSMHGWGHKSLLADRNCGGSIGNDFTNGHRGMARAVRGAKKRARTQLRFHENQATRKLACSVDSE